MSPEEMLEGSFVARRRIGWRIVRDLARRRGLARAGESLADATASHPSPWTEPFQVFPLRHVDLRDPMIASFQRAPFPLLPTACDPILPDEDIERFCEIAQSVGLRLGIHLGADEPAFRLLTDPSIAVRAWPSPDELMELESLETQRVLQQLLRRTELDIHSMLAKEGYQEIEASELIVMAKFAAKRLVLSDPAADRALMLIRLQDEIGNADKSTAKAALLRLMASVQGLLQSGEGAPADKDVGGMVRDVLNLGSGEQRGLLEPPIEPNHEPVKEG